MGMTRRDIPEGPKDFDASLPCSRIVRAQRSIRIIVKEAASARRAGADKYRFKLTGPYFRCLKTSSSSGSASRSQLGVWSLSSPQT